MAYPILLLRIFLCEFVSRDGTSRSNWRNTGRWQRWQTYDNTMGAHPEPQMMLFLLPGASHTNNQGKGLSCLYC